MRHRNQMSSYCKPTCYTRYLMMATIALVASATLTGCGGGTSNQQPPPPPPPPITATETVLYSFVGSNNGATDGYSPLGVIKDPTGNLYGTTSEGGTGFQGTVFRLDALSNETTFYNFQGPPGALLSPTLLMNGAGTFYGTTGMGGSPSCNFGGGLVCGTVFSLDSSGNETVLYNFTGFNGDGSYPGALTSDGAGNFYGTTWQGGDSQCFCGTVFKVDSAGSETPLHAFTGVPDGSFPESSLSEFGGSQVVRDSAGNLYGTTASGGSVSCACGTVFKVDSAGHETVLYDFSGQPDGSQPGNVVMDNAGNLYGTTLAGGVSGNGTVFKVDTSGHETVLYSFTGAQSHDGSAPIGLVLDSSGSLYGVTRSGGSSSNCPSNGNGGCGTFFKLDSTGHETLLYSFKGLPSADGLSPANLMIDSAGNFYGTTSGGGVACTATNVGCGTVFKIVLH